MSQPGSYHQYQLFPESATMVKSGLPPMINGQPNAMPPMQNGVQNPHINPLGTPSSQSSRDPSREPSRDPSPTQFLHNQYRPQLPRPPMPPINGQQLGNRNPISQPPRVTNVPQDRSVLTSAQNITNQTGPGVPISNPTSILNSSVSAPTLASSYTNMQISTQASSSQSSFLASEMSPSTTNHTTPVESGINAFKYSVTSTGFMKSDHPGQNPVFPPMLGQPQHAENTNDFGKVSLPTGNPHASNHQSQAHQLPAVSSQSLHSSSATTTSVQQQLTRVNQNLPPSLSQIQNRNSPGLDQKPPSVITTASTVNQLPQSSNHPQNIVLSQSRSETFQGSLPSVTVPRSQPQQNIFGPPRPNASPIQNVPGYPQQQPKLGSVQDLSAGVEKMSSSIQNTSANTQNLFGNTSQNLSVPQNLSGPLQSRPQSQYPTQLPAQQHLFGSQSSLPQQTQNMYGSQSNLASQRKYPQNSPYGVQQTVATANLSGPTLSGPQRPGAPPTGSGQYQVGPGMQPPPGQLMQGQYDPRSQYPGQMTNVPLDNMSRRYPGSYPDHMNQLNNQMSGMSVAQTGFNKLWGKESVDLLQCRNILPSEKVAPPKITLHQEFLDSVNCSPDIFRCTLTKIPESNSLLQKSRLPLGVLIHPFKDLNHLPVIQCSTIVRCRACRTYINPFVYFVDSKRWKCNLCYRVNELPEEFQFDPVSKSYGDPSRRPEVKTSTIEFIAPSEYMLRPPQPAVYLFILDVSRLAVESGYLTVVCNTIAEELGRLPGDGRTQVGFLAVDSAIHFYSMPDNVSQPHEMIMLDVDDVFLPCPDNLIVNLKEREELVRDLLAQLPTMFQGTHDTNSALGAGLQAAFKLMSPTGGRVTVFQTCLPNLGPGALQQREDPNNRAGKDVPHLNPATDFYKRLALECSGQQIAVDLFLLNSQYSDLATLSGMCKFSGGCIYHLPLFRLNKPQHTEILERMLRRYLTRKIGFEAVMRIRCTRGLSIHTFHGNFFVRSTDLLSLPNVNPDAGFGMQISIEESLSDVQSVCFQAALLYTSSRGERRIRVHTLCLPVAGSLTDILYSADQQCIVGLLSKMAVDRSHQSSLSDARDALINVAIDVLSAYKLSQSVGPSGGLLSPDNLKLLPLYILALLKFIAFRSGTSTRLDDRVYSMCQLKALPLYQLIQLVYPDLYNVHALDDQNVVDIDGKICPQPPRLHLSAEKLDTRGAFLMDAGDRIFIYVGKNIHQTFCSNVLGVPAFVSIPEEMYDLPELNTVESERLRNFLFSLQEDKPYYAPVQIIRDDSHFRKLFTERLIEDRIESALSYYEFLQHLKTQVK